MSEQAEVRLWGRTIGAVLLEDGEDTAIFQYAPEFAAGGIEISPLTMPLRREPYSFPALAHDTFKGLPGLLADSLPDRYGNALINRWLARQGRKPESASAVERLCYMGTRGMGALEFAPARGPDPTEEEDIQVAELVSLASAILSARDGFETSVVAGEEEDGLLEILSVGMSAGGARAKAMIAWERGTGRVRSGQVEAPAGFEHWLLKFDGVSADGDRESLDGPQHYGAIEYAYSRMATAAGIQMAPTRLFEENGRRHFMTRRFDRPTGRAKLHMQSLGGLQHFDFNLDGA
jgi:serine/threonine-protein kinase HipA